jgi:hypothetical protein
MPVLESMVKSSDDVKDNTSSLLSDGTQVGLLSDGTQVIDIKGVYYLVEK